MQTGGPSPPVRRLQCDMFHFAAGGGNGRKMDLVCSTWLSGPCPPVRGLWKGIAFKTWFFSWTVHPQTTLATSGSTLKCDDLGGSGKKPNIQRCPASVGSLWEPSSSSSFLKIGAHLRRLHDFRHLSSHLQSSRGRAGPVVLGGGRSNGDDGRRT